MRGPKVQLSQRNSHQREGMKHICFFFRNISPGFPSNIVFFHPVKGKRPQSSEQREISIEILNWIFHIMKGKVLELIQSFKSLMNDLFQSPGIENATGDTSQLDEKVRSSTLLSIVILLTVIMARYQSRQV